jgi:hypothetical protein
MNPVRSVSDASDDSNREPKNTPGIDDILRTRRASSHASLARAISGDSDDDANAGCGHCCCLRAPKSKADVRRGLTTAAAFIAAACVIFFLGSVLPPKINKEAKDELSTIGVLGSKQAPAYATWASTGDEPLTVNAYLFNVTNAEDVIAGRAKPHVVELGPYVYSHNMRRFQANWSDDSTLLSYKTQTYYLFNPELSNGSESDVVTSANLPFLGIAGVLGGSATDRFFLDLLYGATKPFDRLFVQRPVHELLFGYDDPKLSKVGLPKYSGLLANYSSEEEAASKTLRDEIETGVKDTDAVREYKLWQSHPFVGKCKGLTVTCAAAKRVPIWSSTAANETSPACPVASPVKRTAREWSAVRGTDGSQFSPGGATAHDPPFFMFLANLFRSVRLQKVGPVTFEGVDCIRFQIDPRESYNCTQRPRNRAFNQDWATGLYSIGTALYGSPVFMSLPHFLDVGAEVASLIEGLQPDGVQHRFFVDVEPLSGATFRLLSRMQLNVRFNNIPKMPKGLFGKETWFERMNTFLMPVFWASDDAAATPAIAEKFSNGLFVSEQVASGASIICFSVAFICTILGVIMLITSFRHRQRLKRGFVEGLLHWPRHESRAPSYNYGAASACTRNNSTATTPGATSPGSPASDTGGDGGGGGGGGTAGGGEAEDTLGDFMTPVKSTSSTPSASAFDESVEYGKRQLRGAGVPVNEVTR